MADASSSTDYSSSGDGTKSVIIRIPFVPGDAIWGIWAIAALFVIASVALSLYLIHQHLKYYTQPNHQRYIVRILCMVPLYSIYSLLSLVFHQYQLYFAFLRDTYEAYVLYMFFALCVEYGGGRDAFIEYIASKPPMRLSVPLCYKVRTDARFFKACQQGMLQYVIIRPIVALWSIILQALGLYDDGQFRLDRGYLYNTIIINLCVTVALYVVVIFSRSASDLLAPYEPILKFMCIKIVVFFCFWQSVVISLFVHWGWIPNVDGWSVGEVSVGLQNFLICFEMFIIALMHIKAFPAEMYRVQALSAAPGLYRMDVVQVGSALKAFASSLAQGDMIRDTIDAFRWGDGKPMQKPKRADDLDGADIDLDDFAVFTSGNDESAPESHFLHSINPNAALQGEAHVHIEGAAIVAGENTHNKAKFRSQHAGLLLDAAEDPLSDPLLHAVDDLDGPGISVVDVAAVLEDEQHTVYDYDDSHISSITSRR